MGNSLRFTPTAVDGAVLIESVLRKDERGHFGRLWCMREFAEQGIHFIPVQANTGCSFLKGTLRGLHVQVKPALEAKLVQCTRGSVFDVIVDLRPGSATRFQWVGVELRADRNQMLHVPEGCAHGYQTLEDDTELYYLTSQYFTPDAARGVRFDDPAFGIRWPLPPSIISAQDQSWPLISEGDPYDC